MKCQQPVLTAAEVRYILEGIDYGTQLTRDEVEHALVTGFGFPVSEDDRDCDLVGYLQDLLKG